MITIDVPFNYQLCIIDTRCLSLADDSSRRATELAWTTMQLILFSSVYKRRFGIESHVDSINKYPQNPYEFISRVLLEPSLLPNFSDIQTFGFDTWYNFRI